MRTFPVDDDVLELVWSKAKPAPFEQLTFSDALRRILQQQPTSTLPPLLGPSAHFPVIAADSGRPLELRQQGRQSAAEDLVRGERSGGNPSLQRGRAPKADLRELARLGLLRDGQEVHFVDFRGLRHANCKATIAGDDLLYSDGHRYSMSALAGTLLKQLGFIGDSVRGPDHWETAEGKRIRNLWEAVLLRRGKK